MLRSVGILFCFVSFTRDFHYKKFHDKNMHERFKMKGLCYEGFGKKMCHERFGRNRFCTTR